MLAPALLSPVRRVCRIADHSTEPAAAAAAAHASSAAPPHHAAATTAVAAGGGGGAGGAAGGATIAGGGGATFLVQRLRFGAAAASSSAGPSAVVTGQQHSAAHSGGAAAAGAAPRLHTQFLPLAVAPPTVALCHFPSSASAAGPSSASSTSALEALDLPMPALPSPAAPAAASSSSSGGSVTAASGGAGAHNILSELSFGGDALDELRALGVTAFEAGDVRANLLQRVQRQAGVGPAPSPPPVPAASAASDLPPPPPRRRIPRKPSAAAAAADASADAVDADAAMTPALASASASSAKAKASSKGSAAHNRALAAAFGDLPAESETEKAVRTGVATPFAGGAQERTFTRVARAKVVSVASTAPVAPMPAAPAAAAVPPAVVVKAEPLPPMPPLPALPVFAAAAPPARAVVPAAAPPAAAAASSQQQFVCAAYPHSGRCKRIFQSQKSLNAHYELLRDNAQKAGVDVPDGVPAFADREVAPRPSPKKPKANSKASAAAAAAAPAAASAPASGAVAAGDGTWTCTKCTFVNTLHARRCDACNTPKPRLAQQTSLRSIRARLDAPPSFSRRDTTVIDVDADEHDDDDHSGGDDDGSSRKRKGKKRNSTGSKRQRKPSAAAAAAAAADEEDWIGDGTASDSSASPEDDEDDDVVMLPDSAAAAAGKLHGMSPSKAKQRKAGKALSKGGGKNKRKSTAAAATDDVDAGGDFDGDDEDVVDDDLDAEEDEATAASFSSSSASSVASLRVSNRRLQRAAAADDASNIVYEARVSSARARLAAAAARAKSERERNAKAAGASSAGVAAAATAGADDEPADVLFKGGYTMPGNIWEKLFDYQKQSIKWLWELHCQSCGGIIADEMGLGKTVQIVSFLAGLHYTVSLNSGQLSRQSSNVSDTSVIGGGSGNGNGSIRFGAVLIVCPATIMRQWMREFHTWYPELRVMLLHESGGSSATAANSNGGSGNGETYTRAELVDKVHSHGHILITTYESVRIYQDLLTNRDWGYVILDEGHKIRNPDARVTAACKQLLTPHRIILSGAPIQNRLRELWSLFDFCYPGKLGTLPDFERELCIPIHAGRYANATEQAVRTGRKCAEVLRDLIQPYMLLRTKNDVAQFLPKKTEHVLFCNLTAEQRDTYRSYIHSKEVEQILMGRGSLFKSIFVLRKLCNHPDLLALEGMPGKKRQQPLATIPDYGNSARSGKMQVMAQILSEWHRQGHRALVFSQTRQTLDILERFVGAHPKYTYRRIDGTTPVARRIPLVDEYNGDASIFLMLLTTKAGGLGINLTGADRVLIFDPDWNPSTDAQARERAYRIGQLKNVTVYRLLARGTIEEKVYHRQIFKEFLTARVLRDARATAAQKRLFTAQDMRDLFTLGSEFDDASESSAVLRDSGGEIFEADLKQPAAPAPAAAAAAPASGATTAAAKKGAAAAAASTVHVTGAVEAKETAAAAAAAASVGSKRKSKSEPGAAPVAVKRQKTATGAAATPGGPGGAGGSASQPIDAEAASGADDDALMSLLFEKNGLQSAFDHDKIVGAESSSRRTDSSTARNMEASAERAAKRALDAVRASERGVTAARRSGHELTWTGAIGSAGVDPVAAAAAGGAGADGGAAAAAGARRFGHQIRNTLLATAAAAAGGGGPAVGAPTSAPAPAGPVSGIGSGVGSGATSSAILLARMRARAGAGASFSGVSGLPSTSTSSAETDDGDGGGAGGGRSVSPMPVASAAAAVAAATDGGEVLSDRYTLLLQQLLSFLRDHHMSSGGDGLDSNTILTKFKKQCTQPHDKFVFRQMLTHVAVLQKRHDGVRAWTLKPAFYSSS